MLKIGLRARLIPVALLVAGCSVVRGGSPRQPETTSLLGKPLFAPEGASCNNCVMGVGTSSRQEFVDTLISIGQRLARSWRYREAVEIYSRGIELMPNDARLYRHRGHRFISLRQLPEAVEDLDRAHELDSTSFDIEYHRGLAYYLSGRFSEAADVYARCMAQADLRSMAPDDTVVADPRRCADVAIDDDSRVAMTDWRYRALRRAGRHAESVVLLGTIGDSMRVRDNLSYYENLKRYAGRTGEEHVLAAAAGDSVRFGTSGYAMANWRLITGDTAGAKTLLERVAASPHWPGFGIIAAEVELVRLEPARARRQR